MVVFAEKMGGFQLQPFPALKLKRAPKQLAHWQNARPS
jgi:hypothetical protein